MEFRYFILLFLASFASLATHNRAGEITFKQIGINRYEITLVTYTRIETNADRPIIEINWGDGTLDSLDRSPNFPEFIEDDINKNEYKSIHTFPGPGVYTIYLEDPNRNDQISNIPNSVNVPFYIESKIIINPFLGNNNSPILLNPPIEKACIDAIFQHNPSAFDEDGDSLVFSIIQANGLGGLPIPGYIIPNGLSINPKTGTLTWNKPKRTGEFNLAILIEEYRNDFLIGSIVRDMQVSVKSCANTPPKIHAIKEICVEAGTMLDFKVTATDSDSNQTITLKANGGPLSRVNGDLANFNEVLGKDSVSGSFTWRTGCSHVRKSPYQVLFKAQDNDKEVQLVDLHTLNISIIGPKIKDLVTRAQTNGIKLSWTRNICKEVTRYKVYRKNNSFNWTPDSCETGIPYGGNYELIDILEGRDNNSFIDSNVIDRNIYCYRIVSIFADGAESISSDESCTSAIETKPIPTNADVKLTDSLNGNILIQWLTPNDIDTLDLSTNAFYKLFTFVNGKKNEIFRTSNTDSSGYSFLHEAINTTSKQHQYIIEIIDVLNSDEKIISTSEKFSSVFLVGTAADQKVNLTWSYSTPWIEDTIIIYKDLSQSSQSYDTVYNLNYFEHKKLINGNEYCYIIATYGRYTSDLSKLYINKSQEICVTPQDLVPPCVPKINSKSNCNLNKNTFSWNVGNQNCNSDLSVIQIFHKRYPKDEFALLSLETSPREDSEYVHAELEEVAGCYTFSAIDSAGNESERSHEICFDNCPYYKLPNIFSPNGDNFNEIIRAFPHKYISEVDFKIYNRWGELVYKTNEPNIDWNGRHNLTNLPCSSGVYFYKCILREQRLNGIENRLINGFIQLIQN